MTSTLAAFVALSTAASQTAAQITPFGTYESFGVTSEALSEERDVYVSLPKEYQDSDELYPVLLILDGESLLPPAAGISTFLADLLEIPRMIVVGIPNRARTRDLTPVPMQGWVPPIPPDDDGVGGASTFLAFLVDEVLPEVNGRYRAAPFVTLVGHSLGGLFVAHALAERPDVFGAGIMLDPSFWWNDRAAVRRLTSTLRDHPAAANLRLASVEYAGGFGDDWNGVVLASRASYVGDRITITEGESHGSMPVRGLREGLRALFPDHAPQPPSPGEPAVAALEKQYGKLANLFGYDIQIPIGALNRAARNSIDANAFADARIAQDKLRQRGRADLADALEERIVREENRGAAGFVPLVFPEGRPNQAVLAQFVGQWAGRIDQEFGVDADLILTVTPAADSITLHATQTYPGGVIESAQVLITASADGTITFGHQMRGGVGMEVWDARLVENGNRLIGTLSIRGSRIPPSANAPRASLDLRRQPER